MSKISHHNIEEWLFNYAEGNLNDNEIIQLKSFIKAHPQYAEEMEFWQQTKIHESIPEFNNDALHAIASTRLAGSKRTTALLYLLGIIGLASFLYFLFEYDKQTNSLVSGLTHNVTDNNKTYSYSYLQVDSTDTNFSGNNYSATSDLNITNSLNSAQNNNANITVNNLQINFGKNNLPDNSLLLSNKQSGNKNKLNDINTAYTNLSEENENIIVVNEKNAINNISSEVKIEFNKPEKIKHKNNIYEGFRKEYLKPDPNYIAYKKESPNIEISEQRKTKNKKFIDYELGFHNNKNFYLLHIENNLLNEYAAGAGTNTTGNLHLNYLNRFTGSEQNTASYLVGVDFYSKKLNSGFALVSRYNDIGNGKIDNLNLNFLYSYKIKIDRFNSIETGLGIGYNQTNTFNNSGNPVVEVSPGNKYIVQENSKTEFRKLNLSASAIYHNKYFYALAGSDFILQNESLRVNNENIYTGYLPAKIKAVIGTDFKPYYDNPWCISPQISFIHRGKQNEFWMGAIYRYSGIGGGISVASNKQIMGTLNFIYNKFSMGYNINYSRSYFDNKYYLTHEASLRMSFNALEKKKVAILDSEK